MFKDRFDAAEQLAQRLVQYKNRDDVVVVAIPRGGLQIGSVLAKKLHAPLDVFFSKKIGAPETEELAIGAVALESIYVDPMYEHNPLYIDYINHEKDRLQKLLRERYKRYNPQQRSIPLQNKIIILTDDGIATGNTITLALELLKKQKPKKIIVAVPVGPLETIAALAKKADDVICLITPVDFFGIGQFYQNFAQVDDEEAITLLREANT